MKLIIFTLTCLLSHMNLSKAVDLPVLHPSCFEFEGESNPSELPYPNDCTKFFKCSRGFAFPLTCPRGLHWSVKLNRCEFPSLAGCDSNLVGSTPTAERPRDEYVDGIAVLDCPLNEDPHYPTHLPYPGNCSKFFKCEFGIAHPLNCPYGLHWSIELNRCDWPDVAKCVKAVTTAPSSTLGRTQAPALSAVRTLAPNLAPTSAPAVGPIPVLSSIDLNAICAGRASGYLSYPRDCKRYVQCINGNGRVQYCPGNLLFNSKASVCSLTCA